MIPNKNVLTSIKLEYFFLNYCICCFYQVKSITKINPLTPETIFNLILISVRSRWIELNNPFSLLKKIYLSKNWKGDTSCMIRLNPFSFSVVFQQIYL